MAPDAVTLFFFTIYPPVPMIGLDVKMKKILLVLISGLALFTYAEKKPLLFVSIPPQEWLVTSLAGGKVDVEVLLPPGTNPHAFEPSPRLLKRLAGADLYLTLGMPFEKIIVSKIKALNLNTKVVPLDTGIEKVERGKGMADPHIWLDPGRFSTLATRLYEALCDSYPDQGEEWRTGLERTQGIIREADRNLLRKSGEARVRTWVLYHPSWHYLAERYRWNLLVLEQEGKAPSPRHLVRVIREAKRAGVKVVLTAPQQKASSAAFIAKQIDAKLISVNPLERDWPALMAKMASLME